MELCRNGIEKVRLRDKLPYDIVIPNLKNSLAYWLSNTNIDNNRDWT